MVLTTLDYALGYGRLGWRVLPLWAKDKRPLYANWPKDATSDEKMIRQYFGGDPNRNIGVVCGEKFDAWDIEVEHLDAFGRLWEKNKPLDEAPIARTGRGGMHILTQPTTEGHTRNLMLDGVHIGELKSAGGFIVVAPSVTEHPYSWTWAPTGMALPPAPDWLLGLVRRPPKPAMWEQAHWEEVSLSPATDIEPLVKAVRASVEGDRNELLHWAANRAHDDGIGQDFATKELMDAFIAASREGEGRWEREQEARATIASAYRR